MKEAKEKLSEVSLPKILDWEACGSVLAAVAGVVLS